MTVFSVGVLPKLGLEPGTVGYQTSTLTVRPFNAVIYAKDSSSLTSWREEIRSMSAVVRAIPETSINGIDRFI